MIAKVSSRRHTITIGGQDWSAHYARLTIGRSSLSDDANPGEFVMVGELEISNTISVPESIDPKENPIRWRAGQDIFVQARNDANTAWINTSYSYLKILKVPARPRRGNLILDVGCRLQWALQSQFDGDRSGIIYGQPETSDIVARRLLEASGISAGSISLSTWPYSLQRPIGKQQSSYAGQACDLAYANDWLYLYQDINGNITDSQLNLTVGSAIATVTVGTNELVYEPAEEPERPPEKTKVAGQGYEFSTISNPLVEVDEVREDFSNFSPTLAGRAVSSRITTTKSFTAGANPTYTERVQTSEVEALIFQNPQNPGQILSSRDHIIFEQYETGKEDPSQARLISVDETERVRGRSIRPEDAIINMRETIRNRLDITYAADNDVISRWQSTERQAEVLLDENSNDPWRQREIINDDFQWTEYAPGKFDRTDEVGRALILEDSSLDRSFQNPFSLRVRSKRYDRSGDNKPFETKYFDPGVAEAERQYEATVTYLPDGGPSRRERERLFTVADGFGFSVGQMQRLAEKHLGIMIGRNRQYEIELAVNDALLQAGPLPQVDATDVDALTYSYLADALTFEVTQTKTSALCFGIWIDGGYEPVVNIAAAIQAGQFAVDIIQGSFAITGQIQAAEFTVDVAQSFAIAATISAGDFATEIVITIDIAATVPAGNLATTIAASINISAQMPTGDLVVSVAPNINIAAVIPPGEFVTNITIDPAAAYINALNGIYTPTQEAAFRQFFADLGADATWAGLDEILIFKTQAVGDALISLKTATSVATNNGATFTAGAGFTAGDGSGWIETNWNPTGAINWSQDSATVFYEITAGVSSPSFTADVGGRPSVGANAVYCGVETASTNVTAGVINDSSISSAGNQPGFNVVGVHAFQRTSSNNVDFYTNNTLVVSDGQSSSGVANSTMAVGGIKQGSTIDRQPDTPRQYSIVAFGDASVNVTTLTNAWNTLKGVL